MVGQFRLRAGRGEPLLAAVPRPPVLRSHRLVRNRLLITFFCAAILLPLAARAGTFWSRERGGGVVEFTNKTPPAGSKWKVWLKTGPGKASALRGSTDIVPARDTSPTRFTRYDQHIRDQQGFYGIPEALLRAIIKTESDYDPAVVSSAGAQGLMQLMPDTARLMGCLLYTSPSPRD